MNPMYDDVTYHYSVDETIRRHFEKDLKEGNGRPIEDVLPDQHAPGYLPTLEELVHIEMEFAWKKFESVDDRQRLGVQRVENYIERFPLLNSPEIVERLVKQEYQLRQRFGDQPQPDVYQQRFPNIIDDTSQHLLDESVHKTAFPNVPGYQIVSVLGRGGMGIVFRAIQTSIKRPVALKMLSQAALVDRQALVRFRTEAEAVAKLRDPNVVQIYDVGEFDGRPYFSMELIEGQTLAGKISGIPQAAAESAQLCRTLATSMQHAHGAGIIHRDLKPSNILIGHQGDLKIADFGLAKEVYSEGDQTETGELLGTASYMAPEQAIGDRGKIGFTTDVYGIGAILYEMLTGQPPFRGTAVWDTITMVKEQDPVPPRQLQPKVPRDLETICLKCLNKETHRRYESAERLADDLGRFLNDEPIRARRQTWVGKAIRWSRRNKPLSATIATAALIVILISSISVANVVNERNRFRVQRDRAEDHLQRSLIVSAQALMQARETDWFRQAWGNVEAAAAVENAQDRSTEIREVAVRCLSQPYLSLHVEKSLVGHRGRVFALDVSADGQWLVSGGDYGSIFVWNVESGDLIGRLNGHRSMVMDLAVHPDKQFLVSRDYSGAVLLWDLSSVQAENEDPAAESFRVEEALLLNIGAAEQVELSHDGGLLAVGMSDGSVNLFDVANEVLPIRTIEGQGEPVVALEFDRYGDRIAVCRRFDRSLQLYDVESGDLEQSVATGFTSIAVDFPSDGTGLITSDQQSFGMSTYSTVSNLLNLVGQIHSNAITDLASDSQGRVFSISYDGDIQVHKREGMRFESAARGSFGPGYDLVLAPDESWLAACYYDGVIRLWKLTEPTVRLRGYSFHAGEFIPGTNDWVVCGPNVQRWHLEPGVQVVERDYFSAPAGSGMSVHQNNVWGLSVSPTGAHVASASADRTVKLWDTDQNVLLHTFEVAPRSPEATAWTTTFSQDGSLMICGSAVLSVWNVDTYERIHELPGHEGLIYALAVHPNNRLLVSAGNDHSVRLWDLKLGIPIDVLHKSDRAYWDLAISPDGKRLVAANDDYFVRAWEIDAEGLFADIDRQAANGERLPLVDIDQYVCVTHELDDHKKPVKSVAFTPDGQFLVSGSEQGATIWYDGQSMDPIARLELATGQIRSISFSSDQQFMALCSYGQPVMIWDLTELHAILSRLGVDWKTD